MKSKSKFPRNIHPVLVEWVDSMGTTGWYRGDEPADMNVVSVGNLISKSKDRIKLGLNRSAYSEGDMIEIPFCSVTKIRKLKL